MPLRASIITIYEQLQQNRGCCFPHASYERWFIITWILAVKYTFVNISPTVLYKQNRKMSLTYFQLIIFLCEALLVMQNLHTQNHGNTYLAHDVKIDNYCTIKWLWWNMYFMTYKLYIFYGLYFLETILENFTLFGC